jgi:hypothetical protein
MAYDDHDHETLRPSLTEAIADLLTVGALRDDDDDAALRAALRAAIAGTRDPAGALWDQYRGGRPGSLRLIRRAAR